MSDDDTRELPPVEPEGEPTRARDESAAPIELADETAPHDDAGAEANAEPPTINEETDTMTIEPPADTTSVSDEPATTELPRQNEAPSLEEPTTELPLPAERPTTPLPLPAEPSAAERPTTALPPIARVPVGQPSAGQAPRYDVPPTAGPASPYPQPTGHIRVMSPPPPPPAPPAPEPRKGLRVGTVVWGLIVAVVGVGLLSIAWGAHLDAELALIVLLGAAGVALLVGSLIGMRRSRNRLEGRS